jgi:protocatechuate 3,4-dioxygenase, alpha subunit
MTGAIVRAASVGVLLDPTPEESTGPYYPAAFLDQDPNDLSNPYAGLVVGPEGQRIILSGTVLDMHARGVDAALIEFWHADSRGLYQHPKKNGARTADPWLSGLGRCYCRDGKFELKTIMPGPVPCDDSDRQIRAPHITVTLFCDGINRLVTQVFFEAEPENVRDPLLESLPASLKSRLIASRESDDGQSRRYRWNVILRGESETPFFDDLES